jgi:signal transduction histidine kinase
MAVMNEDAGRPRVVLLAECAPMAALARETVLTALPSVMFETSAPGTLRTPPDADCAIIDHEAAPLGGVEALRQMRAQGFAGGTVLLLEQESPGLLEQARGLGMAERVLKGELVQALPAAVVAALAGSRPADAAFGQWRQLRRMQQMVAAGEVAVGLRHALNNPLAALLAEAQLLEMEPLSEEHLSAVRRVLELCRRVIGLVRKLEGVEGAGSRA